MKKVDIDARLKPLYANLKRLHIGKYLHLQEFELFALEMNWDNVWAECKRVAGQGRTMFGLVSMDEEEREIAFAYFLNVAFGIWHSKKPFNPKYFGTVLLPVLARFARWNSELVNVGPILNNLIALGSPPEQIENFKAEADKIRQAKSAKGSFMNNVFCPLTGYQLKGHAKILETTAPRFDYEFAAIGKAYIALPTYSKWMEAREFKHPELAGICRNAFEDGVEPPVINQELISNLKNLNLPGTLREKGLHLLRFMYKRGGKDYADFEFTASKDYPIAFAEGNEEFNKIMRHLENKGFMVVGNNIEVSGGRNMYSDVQLTDSGIAEVQKELPAIPLIGLVQQEIATGDVSIDEKINFAKKLFLEEPVSMEKMRSACETLSHILEPYREEMKTYFKDKDVSDFFNIVNNFDIRHNKDSTKAIAYPEQLEWVFFTLLNSINTYVKLKRRLA